MRVGLVRNVGLSAVALLALGLAGCDDNPLEIDDGVAVMITTNPSTMIIPADKTTLLETRAIDQGSRPTFDDIAWTIDATCGSAAVAVEVSVTFEPEVQPPVVLDVTGGLTLGTTCITLTGGGVTASVAVTVVGDSLDITGAPALLDVFDTVQLGAVLRSDLGAVVGPFDPTTDLAWSSDDDAVATVGQTGLVTGAGAGNVTIMAEWSNAGVSVSAEVTITIVVPIPVLISTDVASAVPGETVTITGTGFLIGPHAVFLGGLEVSTLGPGLAPTIVNGTTATFRMPISASGAGVGVAAVQVGSLLGGFSNALSVTGLDDPTEPANDVSGPTSPVVTLPIDLIGWVGPGDLDDFFLFTLAAAATLDLSLVWVGASGDLDLLFVDAAFTAFQCGFVTATANVPEAGQCALAAGDYLFWVDDFEGSGAVYNGTASIAP